MKHLLSTFVLFLALFAAPFARATHIVGGHLSYTFISDSVYQVSYTLFADCSSASATANAQLPTALPVICFYDSTDYVFSDTLTYDATLSGSEIGIVCPLAISQCTNITSSLPGIRKHIFSGVVRLPYPSAKWRMISNGSAANLVALGLVASLTNISTTAYVSLRADINSTVHNSSVSFSDTIPAYCALSTPSVYHLIDGDPDGDNLNCVLTPLQLGPGAGSGCSQYSATYLGSSTPSTPVSATSQSLDLATGDFSVTPNLLQRAAVVCEASEYRSGVFVGKSSYFFAVKVVPGPIDCWPTAVASGDVVQQPMVYPNPATGMLYFNAAASAQYTNVSVTNVQGQKIVVAPLPAKGGIDVSGIPAGTYIVSLSGSTGTRSILIQLLDK